MAHFISSQKQIVAMAVTPHLGLEVALLDRKSKTVVKYGRRAIEYNVATREIQNYENFKTVIEELFGELNISLKSDAYLVLPNVHLDFETLPLIIGDEAVDNAILSKAEDSYIFKRVEPVSAWADLTTNTTTDKRFIIYTSFQQTAVAQIKEIFKDLGINLIGIESAYPAILRGLLFTDIVMSEIDDNYNWNLLLINTNSYAMFSMAGSRLVDYTEVPLAIKSFSIEEAYQAIATSVGQVLPNFPAKKLIIVSQAEDICAEVLKAQIVFDEEIVAHDCNKYSKTIPIEIGEDVIQDDAYEISFSLIGSLSFAHTEEKLLTLNLMGPVKEDTGAYFTYYRNGKEISITQEVIDKTLKILTVILALILVPLGGLSYGATVWFNKQAQSLDTKTQSIETDISKITSEEGVIDISTLVGKVIELNKKAISFYDSIATDIPSNLWLQYYYNKDGDKVAIEGISTNIPDIYAYFRSLKVISPASSIKLNRLQILTEVTKGEFDIAAPDVGDRFYDFEISNVTSPKNAKNKRQNGTENGENAQGGENGENKDGNNGNGLVTGDYSKGGDSKDDMAPPPVDSLKPIDDIQ